MTCFKGATFSLSTEVERSKDLTGKTAGMFSLSSESIEASTSSEDEAETVTTGTAGGIVVVTEVLCLTVLARKLR